MASTVSNHNMGNVNNDYNKEDKICLNGESNLDRVNSCTYSVTSSESISTDKFGFIDSNKSLYDKEVNQGADFKVLLRREKKWLQMLSSVETWNLYASKEYNTVRSRCRKGIPSSIRPTAWLHLCGAVALQKEQSTFERLCNRNGEKRWLDDIEKDLDRNFPTHELFGGEYGHIGKPELFKILKAYSIYNPQVGYCQAQAPIAALLVINMP